MTVRKYAPERIGVLVGRGLVTAPVTLTEAFPPGKHPEGCPIRTEWWAVALHTGARTRPRWYGFRNAFIDGSLRMVCELDPSQERDEVLMTWEDVEP